MEVNEGKLTEQEKQELKDFVATLALIPSAQRKEVITRATAFLMGMQLQEQANAPD